MTHLEKAFRILLKELITVLKPVIVFLLNLLWMTSWGRRAYCSHKPQKEKPSDRSFCRVTRIFDWLQTFARDKGGISLTLLWLVIHSDIMCCHKSKETQRERGRERERERAPSWWLNIFRMYGVQRCMKADCCRMHNALLYCCSSSSLCNSRVKRSN